jgi:hypothetical protein
MTPGEPYISLVVTARNDDHGGNLLHRMQVFVSGWIEQSRHHGIRSELILVEWNPLPGRPRLAQALRWPVDFGPCQVRFIEVPHELHNRYAHADALPLYQMIAKNVGIRRARGRFVLATNIDILFSSEFARYLAEQRLVPGRMYRMDRHDVMNEVPVDAPIEEQLAWCRTHLIRINTREGTFNVSPDGKPALSPGDVAEVDSGILFGKGWLPVERYMEPFRWAGQSAELLLDNPPPSVAALLVELEPGPGTGGEPLDLDVTGEDHRVLAHVSVDRRSRLRLPLPSPLPKHLWLRVRGGGLPTRRDPRVLNFRVFRLTWETGRAAAKASLQEVPDPDAASLQSIRAHNPVVAAWLAMQYVLEKLAKGGSLVPLVVPVPPRLRKFLRSYIQWNGFVGMLRYSSARLQRRRKFEQRSPWGVDIFPADSGLRPGAGWRLLDDYRGESFRKVRTGAEVIVAASAPAFDELGLQVETPDGSGPVDLTLFDSAGQAIGKQSVTGLAFARFAVPRTPGRTRILRLRVGDADPAPELKVFWCGWSDGARDIKRPEQLSLPWGAGWSWDPAIGAMMTAGSAELVVRNSAQYNRPLFLDLETAAPLEIKVQAAPGRELATIHAHGRQMHRLDLAIERDRTHILQLSAPGPFHSFGCDWTETSAADAPVFLHTNACGDFTLMARENWFDLRAYPEFDLFSMNLDSVFCSTAHYGGVREEVLADPMRIYHVEHGTGSGWTPEGQAKLFERVAAKGLSFLDNEEVLMWAAQMKRLNSPMIFNHEDWGMAGDDLKETVLP